MEGFYMPIGSREGDSTTTQHQRGPRDPPELMASAKYEQYELVSTKRCRIG